MNTSKKPDEWKEPEKFSPPQVPLDAFPAETQELIRAYHQATKTPIDFEACVIFGTLTAAVFDRFNIEFRDKTGYSRTQPLTLYNVMIADSGSRKSAPFDFFPKKLIELTAKENHEILQKNKMIDEQISLLTKKLNRKNVSDNDIQLALKKKQELLQKKNLFYSNLRTDATMEALTEDAQRNKNQAVSLMSSEPAIINVIAGTSYTQKGNTPNIDLILKGYDGEYTSSLRVGREPVTLKPRVSLCLAGQGVTLKTLVNTGEQAERGFPNRCLFYCPELHYDFERTYTPIPAKLIRQWEDKIQILFYRGRGKNTNCNLKMSYDAIKLHTEFDTKCGKAAEQYRFEGEFKGWICKAPDKAARLAGILALLRDPEADTITENDFRNALTLFESYYIPMAKIAYGITGTETSDTEKKFISRIWNIQQEKNECTVSKLQSSTRGNADDKRNFARILTQLKDKDIIRIEERKPEKGRPAHIIHLNPYYSPQNRL